jgi:ferredoxin
VIVCVRQGSKRSSRLGTALSNQVTARTLAYPKKHWKHLFTSIQLCRKLIMPTIKFADLQIQCTEDENLRRALLNADAPLYNGVSRQIHCHGLGTCGTCAVEICGSVTPMTAIDPRKQRNCRHLGLNRSACWSAFYPLAGTVPVQSD